MGEILHLPLAQVAIDRDYLRRQEPNLFDELWQDQTTRVVAVHEGTILLTSDGSNRIDFQRTEAVSTAVLRAYLGRVALPETGSEAPIVLAVLSKNAAMALQPNQNAWHQLRRVGAGLSELEAALAASSLALSNWHQSHQHCPQCGSVTMVEQGGWVRRCLKDGTELFPRTDPAIIVSVVDQQGRILLGSQGSWEDNRWSVLAGFVEPGESLGHAVEREIWEEAGVRVVNPHYLGSQSWPYPYSLMVAFAAEVASDFDVAATVPDGIEIAKLRWFSRDEMAAEVASLHLPGRLSIARALIEHWFGGRLQAAGESS